MNSFFTHRSNQSRKDFYVDVESDLYYKYKLFKRKLKKKENFVGQFIAVQEKEENRKRGRPRKMRVDGFDKNIS